MEASQSIIANDLYGKQISIGTTVRYVVTRTTGKVIDLKNDEAKTWALIDSTRLYYDTHYLEVTNEQASIDEDEEGARMELEEIEKKIRTMEDTLKVADITSTDSSCEGGG